MAWVTAASSRLLRIDNADNAPFLVAVLSKEQNGVVV